MNLKFIVLLIIILVMGLIGYAIVPSLVHLPREEYGFTYATALTMSMAVIAAIWYLLTTLRAFKASTRIAYYIITAGICLTALTQVAQVGVLTLMTLFPNFNPDQDTLLGIAFFLLYALSALALFFGPIILFFGIRKLARLLGVHSPWILVWLVLGLAIAAAFAAAASLQPPDAETEASAAAIAFGIGGFTSVFAVAGAITALRIKHAISPNYQGAAKWLAIAAAVLAFSVLHEMIVKGTPIVTSWYVEVGLSGWPLLILGLAFMLAGKVLKDASFKTLPANATYLDAVIFTAQLVSSPRAIEGTLNKLRLVTAGIHPESQLSTEDKKNLLEIYRDIEEYPTHTEPLRKLAKPDLRARLTSDFQIELEEADKQLAGASA
jgi:hypothetical protein